MLQKVSPRYPRVLKVDIPGEVFYTTLLRMKQSDGKWHLRHHVESYKVFSGSEEEEGIAERCLERLHIMVYATLIFGNSYPSFPDALDPDQRDERVRLSSEPL
jgi:hypothetical protein